jgi:hypothetical protein
MDPVRAEMTYNNGKGRGWLAVLVRQAVSKMQFYIIKLTNGHNKLHFVTKLHSSETPT